MQRRHGPFGMLWPRIRLPFQRRVYGYGRRAAESRGINICPRVMHRFLLAKLLLPEFLRQPSVRQCRGWEWHGPV